MKKYKKNERLKKRIPYFRVNMDEIHQQKKTDIGLLKAQTENEFLVKIGAKEEEVDCTVGL